MFQAKPFGLETVAVTGGLLMGNGKLVGSKKQVSGRKADIFPAGQEVLSQPTSHQAGWLALELIP
ncbi:hypothetical protein GCM10011494_32940 [Novosphingobium endophyticum]|uniref:Uncharacterized protein n=1 Tax=Novosphingobium endophyticum TaxID=1955250 RepID=A0A916X763_9SPHN|nr:hypothetical protein GCM10011494_32940 [Novosphingobium endophyticum]